MIATDSSPIIGISETRCVDEEVLSDFQDGRPEANTGRRFFDAGHLEALAHASLPNAGDLEYNDSSGVTGESCRNVDWLERRPHLDYCPAEYYLCVIPLELDTRFPAIACIAANDGKEQEG